VNGGYGSAREVGRSRCNGHDLCWNIILLALVLINLFFDLGLEVVGLEWLSSAHPVTQMKSGHTMI